MVGQLWGPHPEDPEAWLIPNAPGGNSQRGGARACDGGRIAVPAP